MSKNDLSLDVLPLEWSDHQPVAVPPVAGEAQHERQQAPPSFVGDNVYDAFAYFLRVEVANGDATQDTVDGYHREVGNWIKWCEVRHIDPAKAQVFHLEAFREDLKRRGLSLATRAHKLSILRQFYQSAVHAGFREDNPAESVWTGRDLSHPEDKLQVLSAEALARLVQSLPSEGLSGLRDRLVIALMVAHGLRRVEIHRLNHENVLGDVESPDPGSLLVDGRGHRMRRVFLRPDTWATLVAYYQIKKANGCELKGAIFVGHGNNGRGKRLSRVSINAIVDKYLNSANLKHLGVSCFALRHTFGTLAVANGADVEHLREAMGHGRLETTTVYVKALEKAKNNPAFFIDVEF